MKLKFNNLPEILDWIREPSHKDHLFLIEAAIAKAKSVDNDKFTVGAYVEFGRPNGKKHFGTIIKCNPKKAIVKEDGRGKWTVPYSLIRLAA